MKFLPNLKLENLQVSNFPDFFKALFNHYGGFLHISQIIGWFDGAISSFFTESSANVVISLWKLLELGFLAQKNIVSLNFAAFRSEMEKTLRVIYRKLKNLSEKEIKELDREFILRMFHYIELGNYKELEELELEIYCKYIFSPYFEKKFKALNDLKDFIERVKSSSFQKAGRSSTSYKEFNFTRYYTVDLVINWLLDNKVLENALRNSTQIEIIKRCQDIISFVASESAKFPNDLLVFLCESMEEAQYEDIKRGYQDILEDLAGFLDQEGLNFVFGKVEENLFEKIKSESYFAFLKRFFFKSTVKTREILLEQRNSKTIELLSNNSKSSHKGNENLTKIEEKKSGDERKSEDSEEMSSFLNENESFFANFFAIDLVWKLIQDESPFSLGKINESLEFFIELLRKASLKSLFKKFFELCLDNILLNKSVYQSLFVMREILKSVENKWNFLDFSLFLGKIQEKHGENLINIVLKEMRNNHGKIFNENDAQRHSYMEIYRMNLVFFQFLKNYTVFRVKPRKKLEKIASLYKTLANKSSFGSVSESLFEITREQIDTMWELFVRNAHNSVETIEFLKSFLNENSRISQNVSRCFDWIFDLFCQYIEENIRKSSLSTVSDEIFTYFLMFYQQCNMNHKNFDVLSDSIVIQCEEEQILGFQTIWNVFLSSDHEKITQDCIQCLVIVYSCLGLEIYGKRTEIFSKFLDKCLGNLKEAALTKKSSLIQKNIKLIESFIMNIERKKCVYVKNRNGNIVTVKPTSEKYEVFQFNASLALKHLRLKISEINEIPLDSFIILHNRNEINQSFDEEKTGALGSDCVSYHVISDARLENPKCMIADKKEFMRIFFDIIDCNLSGCYS